MVKIIDNKIRQVLLRCSVNVFLKQVAIVFCVAGFLTVLAVIAQRLLALDMAVVFESQLWIVLISIVAVAVIVLWYLKRPSRIQVCLLMDDRMKFHERFSTTLTIMEKGRLKSSDSGNTFADAAIKEAVDKTGNLNIKRHFPVRLTRCWIYTGGMWIVVFALFLYLPQKDLLGFMHKRNQQQQQNTQVQKAKTDVNNIARNLAVMLKDLPDPNLAEAISKLDKLPTDVKPEDIKRQAIRQMGDLSEQLKNMQNSVAADSLKMMQQMFQQLRGTTQEFTQKLQQALAQGNYSSASAMLNQLQKELASGKLTDQQKQDMAAQMQKFAQKLEELARKNDELEKELQKQGLDKGLAKLDEKQLRQALQQQGLPSDKIEQLLNKASASRMAQNRMSALAGAMAGAGGESGLDQDELSKAMDQLDQLDSIERQIQLTEASLAEIARAIAGMGEGMGMNGQGGQSPFREGDTSNPGQGSGGPGIGYGARDSDTSGETANKTTRIESNTKQGPVVASWYIKDSQIKGQAVRDYSEVIQAGRDSAAQALSENEIPRRYEETIKKYFGQLENAPTEATGQTENQ
jgi:hypothetical protein